MLWSDYYFFLVGKSWTDCPVYGFTIHDLCLFALRWIFKFYCEKNVIKINLKSLQIGPINQNIEYFW
jgi:hypothetical protein